MEKITKKRIINFFMIVLVLLGVVSIEGLYLGPQRLVVNHQIIENQNIPEAFDDFTIAFFSDTHYLAHNNNEQMERVITLLSEVQPDLILFGGDLIDHPANNPVDSQNQLALIELLSQLKAPYGKYAVYGNHDLEGLVTREETSTILSSAGFQIINNSNIKISKDNATMSLIGIDSLHLGQPDLELGFNGIRMNDFNILLCHTPDLATHINTKLVDVMMSGHSHGHQIYLPFLSQLFLPPEATLYHRGIYHLNEETTLYVTTGVGTTVSPARFLANQEVMFFRLRTTK